jgi:hypothetical protein
MANGTKDRREQLIRSTVLNGIDFVEIASPDQTLLKVHFLNTVALQGNITGATITGGETIPAVSVAKINDATDWSTDVDGLPVLTLHAAVAGDFSNYTLTLTGTKLDPFFARSTFSFKAQCPSTLDCETPAAPCPPPEGAPPPIDYLAKDFLSFRKALLDFSALRYPDWVERSEADFGVMFVEALSSLGDDLSYTQDRVHTEASLDTATQRRSIVRHARLVDYEPRPATSARVLLQFDVKNGPIPPGLLVSASGPDGQVMEFETGSGLNDQSSFPVNAKWNSGILPYIWDDSQSCLEAGSTELWVLGNGFGFTQGQQLLINTVASTPADPPIREIISIGQAVEEFDALFPGPPQPPTAVTHLFLQQPTQYGHDLTLQDDGTPRTTLAGNLVPATQGRRFTESFAIEQAPPSSPLTPLAIDRLRQNSTTESPAFQYLYTIHQAPLAWLGQDDPTAPPLPEILLSGQPPAGSAVEWTWNRRLLDAQQFDNAFTVDPATYRIIANNSDGSFSSEYVDDTGSTIRFGDGEFGQVPEPQTIFTVTYRAGGGVIGNVASDSITKFDPSAGDLISAVTNPFPAQGGADQEPNQTVKRLAPQAFRAVQFRAVRIEDYEAAARRLAFVLRAGTAFRWTGSWLTVFTTADPQGSEQTSFANLIALTQLLNAYRMAGYESYVLTPRYVGLDLKIVVCAKSDAFRGDVQAAILQTVSSRKAADGSTGFFFTDRFTFGTPLEPSALEAAIQNTYGVGGVVSIQFRRRGYTRGFVDMTSPVTVGRNEILRVDNDPSRPERGSVDVSVQGGK